MISINPTDSALIPFVRHALNINDAEPLEMIPIARGGSDRYYRRLQAAGSQWIVMRYGRDRKENAYFADIAHFLATEDIRVPRIIAHDVAQGLMILEDLGDRDLWSFRKVDAAVRLPLYRRTLSLVHRLHRLPVPDASAPHVPLMEPFNSDLYRWERDYFRENFVAGVCGIELNTAEALDLETELAQLAERLGRFELCLIHRDLQSQNVMICGDEPALIDFQGMRAGNFLYDLGALLYDPYVPFTAGERMELLKYYYGLIPRSLPWNAFAEAFQEASVQRLLQALGAYGYLGQRAGHPDFLAHIPRGLENLVEAAGNVPRLEHLRRLLLRCRTAIIPIPNQR